MNFDLEKELQQALRRTEPAPDFAERVMARIAEQHSEPRVVAEVKRTSSRKTTGSLSWWQLLWEPFSMPQLKWVGAAALACLLIAVTVTVQRQRAYQQDLAMRAAEQAEGERAKAQVMLALQIASAKLNVAQRKLNQTAHTDSAAHANEH